MNFLAHFLLTNPTDPAEYQLGSLLPDIAKRAGIQVKASQLENLHPDFSFFKDGIELHWKADRIFHNSHLFGLGMDLWKIKLRPHVPATISKTFFLYHLLFEMWLDRVLMLHQPESDSALYAQLDKIDLPFLDRFAIQVLEDENARLTKTFDGFRKRRFVSHYREADLFAEIALDVFGYVTQQSLPASFASPIIQSLNSLKPEEETILKHWDSLKIEILRT